MVNRPAPLERAKALASRLKPLAAVALLLCALAAANHWGLTQRFNTILSDQRFAVRERPASGEIVLVDIDARSLAEIGVWPWPRRLYADLVRAAEGAGAARIAFDVDFSSASRPEDDEAFAEALGGAGLETFLAGFVQQDPLSAVPRASLPIPPLLDASWPVSVNVPLDADGRVRRFPRATAIGAEPLASMPAVLANREAGSGEILIDHAIAAASIPRVSFVDLLRGGADLPDLRDRTLIVGATAIELHDLFPVPNAGIVSGSTVIALATETLLQNRALAPWTLPLAAVLLVAAAGFWLVSRVPLRRGLVVLAVATGLWEAAALWLYLRSGVMVETATLHLALLGLAAWGASREFDLRRLRLWAARAETRNTLKLLERVVDDGFDAVVIVGPSGRIARINDAARRLLELPAGSSLVGRDALPEALSRTVLSGLDALAARDVPPEPSRGILALAPGEGARLLEYSVAAFWMEGRRARHGEPARIPHGSIILRDVTDRERAQDRLRFAALHDSLTGLSNRRALEETLDALLAGGTPVALLAFDLDRFKGVNDALGHATGDAVLVETARRAEAALPPNASLFRIGGDEFVVVLRSCAPAAARAVAERLVQEIARPFIVRGHRVSIGTSVGSAANDDGCTDASVLRRRADVALYQAKRSSADRVVVFDAGMDTVRLQRLSLEADLKQAVEDDAFEVVYQPQARLRDGAWTGAEALVRWRHPTRGVVSPADFIPVAEETGLIHELGARVLRTACLDARQWPAPVKVAVNVSPLQFVAGDVAGAVREALDASGLDPGRLELEITESAFVGDNARLAAIFDEILALGVTFALDDFGTGYSSLGYLHRFPVSKIKIDRSFVTDIPGSRSSMAVLRSVMALADGMDIRTIAEGIETPEQARLIAELGCGEGQGYLFSRPIDASAVADLLRTTGDGKDSVRSLTDRRPSEVRRGRS